MVAVWTTACVACGRTEANDLWTCWVKSTSKQNTETQWEMAPLLRPLTLCAEWHRLSITTRVHTLFYSANDRVDQPDRVFVVAGESEPVFPTTLGDINRAIATDDARNSWRWWWRHSLLQAHDVTMCNQSTDGVCVCISIRQHKRTVYIYLGVRRSLPHCIKSAHRCTTRCAARLALSVYMHTYRAYIRRRCWQANRPRTGRPTARTALL